MGYYLGRSQELVNFASSLHWAAYFLLQHRFMEVIKTQCQSDGRFLLNVTLPSLTQAKNSSPVK